MSSEYEDFKKTMQFNNYKSNDIPIVVIDQDKKNARSGDLGKKIITIALTGVVTVIIIMLIYTIIKYFETKREKKISNVENTTNNTKTVEERILYDPNSNVVLVEEGNSMVKTVDIFDVNAENKLQVKDKFKNTPFFAMFYSGSCPHCVDSAPHFQNAANKSKNNIVYFAIEDKRIPPNFPIRGYPTLYIWDGHRLGVFNGQITEEKLIDTANDLFEEYESYKIDTEK